MKNNNNFTRQKEHIRNSEPEIRQNPPSIPTPNPNPDYKPPMGNDKQNDKNAHIEAEVYKCPLLSDSTITPGPVVGRHKFKNLGELCKICGFPKDVRKKIKNALHIGKREVKMKNKQKPKTVYVITTGDYSHYHVEAVFEDEKKAKAYACFCIEKGKIVDSLWRYRETVRIEKYKLRDDDVSIRGTEGDFEVVYLYKHSRPYRPGDTEYFDPEYIEGPEAIIKRDYKPDNEMIECVLDDDDFEKAVKILSEKFYIEKAKIEGVSM